MQVGSDGWSFEWNEHWARIPATRWGASNGRTHGVTVAGNGHVFVFNQAQPAVLEFDPAGRLLNAWGDRFHGAHGMTLVAEGDEEFLWLTDQATGEVVKTTLDGKPVLNLQRPDLPIYQSDQARAYAPTWVAVNEVGRGGNGDIWVADGYGSSYIHRYSNKGAYIASINGTEGAAGAFACPHGIRFDFRHGRPELYITDRSNRRIQVHDADGKYLRQFGQDFLTSPCMFAVHGDHLLIPELYGRLAVLDSQDRLVCYLGCNDGVEKTAGWPNLPADRILAGKFNSPHAMTADAQGNLYVVEWIVGGRITKLLRT